MSASALLERLGRRIAVDFGLGSLVTKLEEYFGKRVTGALLALVALAITVACIKFLWETAIGPIVRVIEGLVRGANLNDLLFQALIYLGGWVFGSGLLYLVLRWLLWPRFERAASQANASLASARATFEKAQLLEARAGRLIEESEALVADYREDNPKPATPPNTENTRD